MNQSYYPLGTDMKDSIPHTGQIFLKKILGFIPNLDGRKTQLTRMFGWMIKIVGMNNIQELN